MRQKDLKYIDAVNKRSIKLGLDAKIVLEWDYNGWRQLTNHELLYTQKDWNSTLITMINMASQQLDNKAKCLIISPEVAAIIDDNPLLLYSMYASNDPFTIHGSLGDYKIFLNRYLSSNSVVIVNEEEFLDLTVETVGALVYIKGLNTVQLKEIK